MSATLDNFTGCLIGLAVGDAVGAPYEGLPPDIVFLRGPARSIVETPTEQTRYYTDDTQMAIGVAETLAEWGEIREDALCAAFVENFEPGRGYGQGTARLIRAMSAKEDYRQLARTIFPGGSLGNGAAMRVAPVGLIFCDDLDRVGAEAELSATPTHVHPLAVDGARLVALAVTLAARERRIVRADFLEQLRTRAKTDEFQWQLSVARQLTPDDTVSGFGNSLAAHRSVTTAIACFANAPDDYTEVISRAIGQGNDTDTLAAMAGAICGAHVGIDGIPAHLVNSLEDGPKGRTYIEELAKRLYHAHLEWQRG